MMRPVSEIGMRTTGGWLLSCAGCCREAIIVAGYHKVSAPWRCNRCENKETAMATTGQGMNINEAKAEVLTDLIVRLQRRAIREAADAKRTGNWNRFNGLLEAIDDLKAQRGPVAEVA